MNWTPCYDMKRDLVEVTEKDLLAARGVARR